MRSAKCILVRKINTYHHPLHKPLNIIYDIPMNEIQTLPQSAYKKHFPALCEIPKPPETIYVRGDITNLENIQHFITIIGTRKPSPYGLSALKKIIDGLRGYPIAIISGLAHGIDAHAHKFALDNNIVTICVPGSGITDSVIYPKPHLNLAHKILNSGGLLLTEFKPDQPSAIWTFPNRNRIMAGLSQLVLCIEAEQKSGSMITTKLATDYNRTVCAVPGSIFSSLADGPHMLIKMGAFPITEAKDILDILGLEENEQATHFDYSHIPHAQFILTSIKNTPKTSQKISEELGIPIHTLLISITLLELENIIHNQSGLLIVK